MKYDWIEKILIALVIVLTATVISVQIYIY